MPDLRFADHLEHIQQIIDAAMEAADPSRALRSNWPTALENAERCYVVGAGKGSVKMALELERILGERLLGGVVAVVPERWEKLTEPPKRFKAMTASHPLPDESNIHAAREIARVAEKAGEKDTLIALLSGGASAHLTLPVDDVRLEDLRAITLALQHAGAPIEHLNLVRKHCELLKGGGLARLAHPAKVWSFILSDVVGDSLNVIASGPTAPDPTTYADALDILKYYNLLHAVPNITNHLRAGARGERPETMQPGDEILLDVHNMLIGSNRLALSAARKEAGREGWNVVGYEIGVEGEARVVGMILGLRAIDLMERPDRPCCWLMGGETTVTVHGHGKGGRCQESALGTALAIDGMQNIAIACYATDGIDGPTDAAGAIVTGETCARGRAMGVDPQDYLNANNSHEFFEKVGGLIKVGPTGTNVNDIMMALVY